MSSFWPRNSSAKNSLPGRILTTHPYSPRLSSLYKRPRLSSALVFLPSLLLHTLEDSIPSRSRRLRSISGREATSLFSLTMALPNPRDDIRPAVIDAVAGIVEENLKRVCNDYEDAILPLWESIEHERQCFEERRKLILDGVNSVLAPGVLKRCWEAGLGAIEPEILDRMRSRLTCPRTWSPTPHTLPLIQPDDPSARSSAISDRTTLGPARGTSHNSDMAAPSTSNASPVRLGNTRTSSEPHS